MEVPATVAVAGTSVYECNGFRLVAKKTGKGQRNCPRELRLASREDG